MIITTVYNQAGKVTSVVIDAVGDAALLHSCGAYVSPVFSGSGVQLWCPRCKQAVGN